MAAALTDASRAAADVAHRVSTAESAETAVDADRQVAAASPALSDAQRPDGLRRLAAPAARASAAPPADESRGAAAQAAPRVLHR
jgi:hypothetical protein